MANHLARQMYAQSGAIDSGRRALHVVALILTSVVVAWIAA